MVLPGARAMVDQSIRIDDKNLRLFSQVTKSSEIQLYQFVPLLLLYKACAGVQYVKYILFSYTCEHAAHWACKSLVDKERQEFNLMIYLRFVLDLS